MPCLSLFGNSLCGSGAGLDGEDGATIDGVSIADLVAAHRAAKEATHG